MGLRPPEEIVAILISFVIAVTIHEFMHAWSANRLGDPTARNLGRITLNPLSHFEPFGFIGMVLISLGFPFVGWGKPVPVSPGRFQYTFGGRRQRGMAIVAIAGPISNIVQAIVAVVLLRVLFEGGAGDSAFAFFLNSFIFVNVLLASFNMIPVPPLDGHKILMGLLPDFWQPILAPLERFGLLILIAIIFIGGQLGQDIFSALINPMRTTLYSLLALFV